MIMTDAEIRFDYEHGKSKREMIKVLADQNCVSAKEMAQYIADLGYDVDKRLLPKKKVEDADPDPDVMAAVGTKKAEEQTTKFEKIIDSVDEGRRIPEPIIVPGPPPRPDQSVKADASKPRLTLVPMQILFDIAEIREYGNRKYPEGGPDNWKQVEPERYREAMFRHMLRYIDDPVGVDEESGMPHLWHLACNVAFLCELEAKK